MSDTTDEPRPIHFRPTPSDAELLDELHVRTGLRSSTELLRWCIRAGFAAAPNVPRPGSVASSSRRDFEGGEG